jgi:flagellar hook-length control protein FliK
MTTADHKSPTDAVAMTSGAAAGAALAAGATAEPVEAAAPKLVIPPNRVDTVAVAAARASAEATRPIRLSIRLDPPNLGEVRVELTARGNQVTMRLEPTAEIAGPALHQQRAAVAAALERTGFQLAGFDIANPEQQKQGFVPKHAGRRDAGAETDEPTEATTAADGLRI